jgi:lipopolysaccharide transport system ATP-binding protein
MSTDSISVTGISKAYKQYTTRWSRLAEWLLGAARSKHIVKWVLRDISFRVAAGEAVGIIGINGAGKSTLLRIITGTTQATTGTVELRGSVAAMLELGMGFHPDFTGRQNVFMSGQLMGLRVDEIAALMPEIEAFAEIGDYIDQPVRVYSSGMQVRLAFSVSTARRPDILIVDEALSVGDTYFQHKSFDRIRKFRESGTTLLIVSHDKMSIQSMCDRAILLDEGRMLKEGQPEEVMDYYNAMIADRRNLRVTQRTVENGKVQTISGTGEVSISDVTLLNEAGEKLDVLDVGSWVTLEVAVRAHEPVPRLVVGYMIKDRLGQPIYGTNTHLKEKPIYDVNPGEEIVYQFRFQANLGPGSYSIAVALTHDETHLIKNYEWRDLALVFNVVNLTKSYFAGSNWLDPQIQIQREHQRLEAYGMTATERSGC